MKKTQYEKILVALRAAGSRGMTNMELIMAAGSVCPWKRLAELEFRTPNLLIVRSTEDRSGKRLIVYRIGRG